MNEIVLTIAIPTYNRKKTLIKALESVLSQKCDKIEILVSDNASTDGTEAVCKKYEKSGMIRYFRHKKNLGMDGNFYNCFKQARGRYIQMLSDDDLLLPGAVNHVLALIERESPDYIHLNAFSYTGEIVHSKIKERGWIPLEQELISADKQEYMSVIGIFITFISSVVIKRESILPVEKLKKYWGTYFLHAHAVFTSLAGENKKVIVTEKPFVASKSGNTGGYNLYQVWIREYKRLLLITAVKSGFSIDDMRAQYRNDVCNTIRTFIYSFRTEQNMLDVKNRRILFAETIRYPEIVLKVWPVAILPKCVLIVLRTFMRRRKPWGKR